MPIRPTSFRKQQLWRRSSFLRYSAAFLVFSQIVYRLIPIPSPHIGKEDALSGIRYDEDLTTMGLEKNEQSHEINILNCKGDTTISNRVVFPAQFMKNPQFMIFLQDLERNNHLVKSNYIVYGDRSSKQFSVYFHIHKCGGTTMEYMSTKHVQKEDLNWKTEQEIGTLAFNDNILNLLEDIDDKVATLFSFCRDPVIRFLSSLGQLLSMKQRHHKLAPCTDLHKRSVRKLVSCVLDKITDSSDYRNYLDPHFMPQIYELYSAVQGKSEIRIQLFALSSLDNLQRCCSIDDESSTSANPSRYRVAQHVPGFPKLSVHSLTPQLIDRICQVYVMDVLFLQYLGGLESTLCQSS